MALDLPRFRQLLADVEWSPEELAIVNEGVRELEAARARLKPTLESLFAGGVGEAPRTDGAGLHFVIATPMSIKNTKRAGIAWSGTGGKGRAFQFRTQDARDAVELIQDVAVAALRAQAPQSFEGNRPLFPDDEVRVEMVHNVANETVDVLVVRSAPKPKRPFARKRDVHNLPEIVCDAIQGIAFRNDNQVADLRIVRNVGAPTNAGEKNL